METGNFVEISQGALEGFLYERQYDDFVGSLTEKRNWFAYDFSKGDFIFLAISEEDLKERLIACRDEVKSRKKFNTFPFTYVKNKENPVFIKLYDPMKCGSSCSITTPDPWWVFSTVNPEKEEILKVFPAKTEKKSFFKSFSS